MLENIKHANDLLRKLVAFSLHAILAQPASCQSVSLWITIKIPTKGSPLASWQYVHAMTILSTARKEDWEFTSDCKGQVGMDPPFCKMRPTPVRKFIRLAWWTIPWNNSQEMQLPCPLFSCRAPTIELRDSNSIEGQIWNALSSDWRAAVKSRFLSMPSELLQDWVHSLVQF